MPHRTVLRIARPGVAATLFALLASRPALADANGQWQGIAPPAGRLEHVALYDEGQDRLIVVLGQYDAQTLQLVERDVWYRSFAPFGGWHEMIASGTGPVGAVAGQMVYDNHRGRFVMASGSTLTTFDLFSQTWSTATIAGTPPSSRSGTTAIYDDYNDRIVYFGGDDGTTQLNEVWTVELNLVPTWVQLTPSGTPPQGRRYASAVNDDAGLRMIVFGGELDNGNVLAQDVWALSLLGPGAPAWTEITPAIPGPAGRSNAAVVMDRHSNPNRMLMQGGTSNTSDAQLWALDLGETPAWSVVPTTGAAPGLHTGHTMSYDTQRNRILLYGGDTGDYPRHPSADLYALDLASGVWTSLSDPRPAPRSEHAAAYDPAGQRMILCGGDVGSSETWSLSLGAQPVWTPLAPSGSPPAFVYHRAVIDAGRQRMLVFAGWLGTPQVWSFDLAGSPAWTQVATTGTPPSMRRWPAVIDDPNGDRLIVYGGLDAVGSKLNDVWQLTLGGTPTWTELHPAGTAPTARYRPSAIDDPVGARMLIFGGNGSTSAGELWSLSLTGPPTWQLLTPSGTSVPRGWGGHAAAYDDSRQRMLLYGGGVGGTDNSTSTYALSLAGALQWSLLGPTGQRPVTGCSQSAIYDSGFDRMVVYGGRWCSGIPEETVEDAAWSLGFGSTVSTPVAALPADVQLFPAVPNPASGDVTLSFALPRAANARLAIYDLAGRKIAEPFAGTLTAGRHEVRWTRAARDAAGLGPGVYFSELRAGNQRAARRMVVTR